MKLVCVVFKEETPCQFEDTVKLFNYGFENFKKLMVDDYETKYSMDNLDLFDTGSDLFGDSTPLMSMETDSYIIVPNTAEFEDADSKVTYSKEADSNVIATIEYSYSNVPIGTCDIMFSSALPEQFNFSTPNEESAEFSSEAASLSITEEEQQTGQNIIFINVKKVILGILIVAGIVIVIMVFLSILSSYSFSPRGQSSKRRKQRIRDNRIAKKNARRAAKRQRQQMKRKRKAYKKRKHSTFRRTYD